MPKRQILVLIILFFTVVLSFSQTRYTSNVIIVAIPVERESTNLYGDIISGFMLTVLDNEGLPATVDQAFEHEMSAEALIAPGEDEVSVMVEFGKKNDADFVLICAYEARGNEILLYSHMVDVEANELVTTSEERARPILMMDGAIYRSLDHILTSLKSRFVEIPESEIVVDPGDGEDPPPEPPKQLREPGFSLSAGVGALGSLGKAAEYFQMGITPLLQFGYGFNTVVGQLSIGVLLATSYFEAAGASSESQNIFSPFGLKFGYMSNGGGFLDVSFSISGGGTVLAMNPDQTEFMVKLVPFAMAGLGFVALPTQVVSIIVDVSAVMFFDTELIIGFVPAIHLSVHF